MARLLSFVLYVYKSLVMKLLLAANQAYLKGKKWTVVKLSAIHSFPCIILLSFHSNDLFKLCLRCHCFPDTWRLQKMNLIMKSYMNINTWGNNSEHSRASNQQKGMQRDSAWATLLKDENTSDPEGKQITWEREIKDGGRNVKLSHH